MTTAQLMVWAAGAGVALWVLHKVGQFLTKVLEALAAVAVVFITAWLLVKGVWKTGRWMVRHWRTTLAAALLLGWLHWLGVISLGATVGGLTLVLLGWRWLGRE